MQANQSSTLDESVKYEDTRIDIRLLGSSTNLESQATSCSASRSAMRASFLKQMLVLEGATPRRIITGAEREYGKYTMSIDLPSDARIIKVIQKYPRWQGIRNFKRNSETCVIYEDLKTGALGSLIVPNFHWNHKVFGFPYKHSNLFRNLTEGTILAKGDKLADSPSVQDNGDYWYGIETKTAFLSVPGIIEDGIVASESYCKKLRTRGYGSKVVEWGHDAYPLNLYGKDGDVENYKYFPDIGERIRDDGILFALRKYDPILAVCDMTNEALRTVNHTFDDITYISLSSVDGVDMPIVEDVSVWHTHNPDLWRTPVGMEPQIRRYHEATKKYHTDIYEAYEVESKKHQQGSVKYQPKLTNEFHNLLVNCLVNDNNVPFAKLPKSVARTFRRAKLDDWRVEIKYGWTITPGMGYKIKSVVHFS